MAKQVCDQGEGDGGAKEGRASTERGRVSVDRDGGENAGLCRARDRAGRREGETG